MLFNKNGRVKALLCSDLLRDIIPDAQLCQYCNHKAELNKLNYQLSDLRDLTEQKNLGKFICNCDPEHYKPDLVCRLTQQDQCKLIANDPLFNVKLTEPELLSKRLDKIQLFVLD